MADQDTLNDLFTDEQLFDLAAVTPPTRQDPLTTEERLIVQNLFDTQPTRRREYLRQLGFEMDPNDDNRVRPIGATGPYTAEIDPGLGAFFQKGGLKELGKDVGDISFDVLASGGLAGAGAAAGLSGGAAAGGAAGAAVTGPAAPAGAGIGATIGGGLGFVLGGALGNFTAEELKTVLGDIALEKSIPPDRKLQAIQSMVVGAFPAIFKAGRKISTPVVKTILNRRKKAIINAAVASGGGVTEEILERAAREPELFSDEAVKGATGRLKDSFQQIFGTSPVEVSSPKQITGGIFGAKMKPLNEAAEAEIKRLAQNPEANWKLMELLGPIEEQAAQLSGKFARSSEEEAALKYLRGKAKLLKGQASKRDGVINFREGREFLRSIQDDAFNRELPGASIIAPISRSIRELADTKAGQFNSQLPAINQQRSNIMQFYNTAQKNLTPTQITSAFIGQDTIKKDAVRETFKQMDTMLGTNFTPAVETQAMQRVVENLYRNPKGFGSGAVITEALTEGGRGALFGAGAGFGAGIATGGAAATPVAIAGAIGGGLAGASRGATLASPQRAIKQFGKTLAKEDALTALQREGLINAPLTPRTQAVAQQLGREVGRSEAITEPSPVVPVAEAIERGDLDDLFRDEDEF
jgi:hypothetical protein